MNKEQNNVLEWMDTFGQACPAKPCVPSLAIRKLRAKLILEETLETIAALGFDAELNGDWDMYYNSSQKLHIDNLNFIDSENPNLDAIADGIADLNYVSYGTAIACGLDMEPIEHEVHKNNMSKLWSSEELMEEYSEESMKDLKLEKLPAGKYKGLWIVKDKHGKILKPPGHNKPNLESLIKSQE